MSIIQGPQGLSAHFEMALTGRKNVAMSKLMVASNSQRRHILNIWSVFMWLSNPGTLIFPLDQIKEKFFSSSGNGL